MHCCCNHALLLRSTWNFSVRIQNRGKFSLQALKTPPGVWHRQLRAPSGRPSSQHTNEQSSTLYCV